MTETGSISVNKMLMGRFFNKVGNESVLKISPSKNNYSGSKPFKLAMNSPTDLLSVHLNSTRYHPYFFSSSLLPSILPPLTKKRKKEKGPTPTSNQEEKESKSNKKQKPISLFTPQPQLNNKQKPISKPMFHL